jgi:cell wall-associated NlpC family hydrolase
VDRLCAGGRALLTACSSTTGIKHSGNPTIDRALERGNALRGTPYCYAGSTPDCFDCSGFVHYCLAQAGVTVPRTTADLFAYGEPIELDALEPGDLVFFNTTGNGVSHVGFFVGNGAFLHSSTSSGVIVSKLAEPYWSPKYLGARRIR